MVERLENITKLFLEKSHPGIGHVYIQEGVDCKTHTNEIETAYWLLDTFGGEITVLKEKCVYLVSNPDYEWNGKLWELKSPAKRNSLEKRLRKGVIQTTSKQGGIIFDIYKMNIDFNTVCSILNYNISSYKKYKGLFIIKNKTKLIGVYKIKKN